MRLPESILDTDTLCAIMRQHPLAWKRSKEYLACHDRFTFSTLTRYEVLRGLMAKDARRQLQAFEQLCNVSYVVALADEVVVEGARIYAELYRQGCLISDADILIAATAKVRGLTLVTNNEDHFMRITQLPIENWLKPSEDGQGDTEAQ